LDPRRPIINDVAIEEFRAGFERVRERAESDPLIERREGEERGERFVPGSALESEETFNAWLSRLPGTPVVPEWGAGVSLMVRSVLRGRFRVSASLENLSTDPTIQRRRRRTGQPDRVHDDARDHFLFRTRLQVIAAAGVIEAVEMNLGPDEYRYDPRLPAYASNCGVEAREDSDGRIVSIVSVPSPVHETFRRPPNDHASTPFARLAGDPLPLLDAVARDLRAYAGAADWNTSGLRSDLAERMAQDRRAFELEVARFEDGVRWLRRDARLMLAFRLTNRTMMRLGERSDSRADRWRLFQLVFIVSQLSALAWREHDPAEFTPALWGEGDAADPTAAATVLWYPTAGGKTEAYLGLVICAMFYDRARGKRQGVTAWCRFPLRLLSLQQTQRQLDVIVAADEVRRQADAELAAVGGDVGSRFSVGFFVGEGNTPNSISRDREVLARLIADPQRRREVRVVDECPYCRRRAVEVMPPDANELRLIHRCTACDRELPLHIVDSEVYRYLPSLLVGTLDKLAMIGLSDRFGAILGDVDCECVVHGFGRGLKCHERRAEEHPDPAVSVRPLAEPLYDASPSLEIIDELHMVDEELGAFTGHYEGLLAAVQRRLSARCRRDGRGVRTKVVATTATIEGEDRQCDHLFGLRSVVFPLPGPSLSGSFYWQLSDAQPLRNFVGVLPHRATAEMALVRIVISIHAAIRRLESEGPRLIPALGRMTDSDFRELVDLYRVSLTYVTSLVDFGKLRRSMDTQVNEALRRRGMREVSVRELSGDATFDEVRATLDDLLSGRQTEAVVATSMISHGVDVDRLNIMVFNGMPKAMAEYIQASSRVGRRYLGVVFMIFNPVRERDRSHFRYHGKFHEYLDRMVEPVAINRWSRWAARKTLPGLLMGQILQCGNRAYWDAGRAPKHLHDLARMQEALRPPGAGGIEAVQPEVLLEAMREAYLADRDEATELRQDVEERVRMAASSIRAAGAAASANVRARGTYRGTGDYLGLEYSPMISLRDIADGLPFYVVADRRRR
jgi:hypothetical protein